MPAHSSSTADAATVIFAKVLINELPLLYIPYTYASYTPYTSILIEECPCKFMLVIKKTDYIYGLYKDKGLRIIEQDKNYFVSFKNRNKKNVKHLIIMNYLEE